MGSIIIHNQGYFKSIRIVILLRDKIKQNKALDTETIKLVGTDKYTIIYEISTLIPEPMVLEAIAKANNPDGDGYSML